MSSWTEISTTQTGPASWRLDAAVTYHVGALPSPLGWTVTVPAGYVCDLASVPRVWRWLVDRDGLAPAALLHDWLLSLGYSRVVADACFYEAARACGASALQASLAYAGVRLWAVARLFRGRRPSPPITPRARVGP